MVQSQYIYIHTHTILSPKESNLEITKALRIQPTSSIIRSVVFIWQCSRILLKLNIKRRTRSTLICFAAAEC